MAQATWFRETLVLISFLAVGCAGPTESATNAAADLRCEDVSGKDEVCYAVVRGEKIYQGDIKLGPAEEPNGRRAYIMNSSFLAGHKWANGVVPYTIDPALPNPQRIADAIAHYNQFTTIRLIPRTTQTDYATFRPISDIACYANFGRIGGQQFIDLDKACGVTEVIHEIGHAIGFLHEQGRADRDANVTIVWANVLVGFEHAFRQDPQIAADYGPYDFGSVMHYHPYAFSKNGQPTITRKNGSIDGIGRASGLSSSDRAAIASMYGATPPPPPPPPPQLPGLNLTGVAHVIVAAPASGVGQTQVWNAANGSLLGAVDPYPGFSGGVSVAVGDVNGDGVLDIITGAGPGGGPHVVVFNGVGGGRIRNFFPYESSFRGGVFVAAGDVNGDGADDVICGTGVGGGPRVSIFDGRSGSRIADFFAYESSFRGGVLVASGDVDGDGIDEVIVGTGPGGGPRIRVLRANTGYTAIADFFAFESSFRGGVKVGAGDIDGDGKADVLAGAGTGGGPRALARRGLNVSSSLADFFSGDTNSRAGVNVAATVFGGQRAMITGAGPFGESAVRVYAPNGTLLWRAAMPAGGSGANVAGK